jgi:hypothetical protein
MKALQEMILLQTNGKKYDFLKIKFHICQQITIDGLLDLYDLVDLILKYSIGYETLNILLSEAMLKMMRITGWKYGIMYLWNFTVMIHELFQN